MLGIKTIPLLTVTGQDWQSHVHLHALESYIAKGHTVCCNSVQTAVQMCLELLGTRTEIIPVLMPVTAPADTLAAVLRSGAQPVLLDIDPITLQMSVEQVKEALEALPTVILLLTRPAGQPVSEELLALAKPHPSICDARLIPHPGLEADDLPAVFNIFDLTQLVGSGAAIIHKFPKQVDQLKTIRSGIMGHSGFLPEVQAELALKYLKPEFSCNIYSKIVTKLSSLLSTNIGISSISAKWPAPLWVHVPNAKKVIAHLSSYGVEAAIGLPLLCEIDEVLIRYKEAPEYPVAKERSEHFVCVPTHADMWGREEQVVSWIGEAL